MDLFSRMFLADGPGAERDSFLAARAGVAGRLARCVTMNASLIRLFSYFLFVVVAKYAEIRQCRTHAFSVLSR